MIGMLAARGRRRRSDLTCEYKPGQNNRDHVYYPDNLLNMFNAGHTFYLETHIFYDTGDVTHIFVSLFPRSSQNK